MKYTSHFREALNFAEKEKLYLGSGNPDGKILVIGKEHYFNHNFNIDTDDFYQEILQHRSKEITQNISSWKNNIDNNFFPDWDPDLNIEKININPFTIYWNQKNKNNRIINGIGNGGTSNTYVNYQKIYQNVFLEGKKEENINFQKLFFLSELNDLPSKKSFNFPKLKDLRKEFINQRKNLFRQDFFRSFPVTIIATGHYPNEYDFNIEEVFQVNWIGETSIVGNSWFNIHYSDDKKRILIHTRQLSTSVPNHLIISISNLISNFLNNNSRI